MALSAHRKAFHVAGSLTALIVAYFVPFPARTLVAAAAFLLVLFFDLKRLSEPDHEMFKGGLWKRCLREVEKRRFSGSLWLTLGFLAISFFHSREIIFLALIYAGFADPMAEIFGHFSFTRRYSPNNRKTIGGSLGFFLTALALSWLALYYLFEEPRWLAMGFLGSAFAAVLESLEIQVEGHYLNDNFLVPVGSSLFLKCVFF